MLSLDQVIAAYECYDNLDKSPCNKCPYGYGFWDDNYDYPIWTCDNERLEHDMLGYLKIYQYLVKENEKASKRNSI